MITVLAETIVGIVVGYKHTLKALGFKNLNIFGNWYLSVQRTFLCVAVHI